MRRLVLIPSRPEWQQLTQGLSGEPLQEPLFGLQKEGGIWAICGIGPTAAALSTAWLLERYQVDQLGPLSLGFRVVAQSPVAGGLPRFLEDHQPGHEAVRLDVHDPFRQLVPRLGTSEGPAGIEVASRLRVREYTMERTEIVGFHVP